jgi:glycogen(starch) synthase
MKILLQTRFAPSVGGIETLALLLCREWLALGHAVTVITDVAAPQSSCTVPTCFVVYQPSYLETWRLWRMHDVVVMMNVSLHAIWPSWLSCSTPVVFVHHSPYELDRDGTRNWRELLKLRIARRNPFNICCSSYIRDLIDNPSAQVVLNCYDDTVFADGVQSTHARFRKVVFVGRLVSDKGANLLLDSVAALPNASSVSVTIIGDGPERQSLESQAKALGLAAVRFVGSLGPSQVAEELRQHQVMVVPSLWREPFGIVALEGMACGCAVLVANGGGLPEAVGTAGRTFVRGDVASLVENLSTLLNEPSLRAQLAEQAAPHLKRHGSKQMAGAYLEVIHRAVQVEHSKQKCINTLSI